MNLTGQPPHQKGIKRRSRGTARQPNAAEKRHWHRVLTLTCIVGPIGCAGRTTIHHCGTGAGGRKDHMKVIPLCLEHHTGRDGIDGGMLSKKKWQLKYATEEVLLARVRRYLKHFLTTNPNGELQ